MVGSMTECVQRFCATIWRYQETQGGWHDTEQLAEKANLASKMISLIERFERNPTLNAADSIAQGLGVPLWQLIRDADGMKRAEMISLLAARRRVVNTAPARDQCAVGTTAEIVRAGDGRRNASWRGWKRGVALACRPVNW